MEALTIIIVLSLALFVLYKKKNATVVELIEVPKKWKAFLNEKVVFYNNLKQEQKERFELDVYNFLNDVRITGVQTKITIEDRLLVASSAVIPLFGFPQWTYKHLDEVLIYPSSFDRNFNIGSKEEIITGMVGTGVMEGKMILSKQSLHLGFSIANDKKNVGIHEFVHLFDKEDGLTDGIPPGFNDKSFALPWLDLVNQKTNEILSGESDINEYGATKREEFFPVASEYFFERPHLLKSKHPKLYEALSKVFRQDTSAIISKDSFNKKKTIGRNSPCPCGSGEKNKRCCLG